MRRAQIQVQTTILNRHGDSCHTELVGWSIEGQCARGIRRRISDSGMLQDCGVTARCSNPQWLAFRKAGCDSRQVDCER